MAMDDAPKAPNGRPKIRPPLSLVEWLLVLATFVGAIFTIVLLAVSWPALPASVPSHFGVSGRPDAYGGKGTLIFLAVLAVLAVAFAIGFALLCRYPWTYNYPWVITEENAAPVPSRSYLVALVGTGVCRAVRLHCMDHHSGRADQWWRPWPLVSAHRGRHAHPHLPHLLPRRRTSEVTACVNLALPSCALGM